MSNHVGIEPIEVIKIAGFAGFLVSSTLLVGVHFKIFKFVFGDSAADYWWLFLFSALIPLFLMLYLFSLLFGMDYVFVL